MIRGALVCTREMRAPPRRTARLLPPPATPGSQRAARNPRFALSPSQADARTPAVTAAPRAALRTCAAPFLVAPLPYARSSSPPPRPNGARVPASPPTPPPAPSPWRRTRRPRADAPPHAAPHAGATPPPARSCALTPSRASTPSTSPLAPASRPLVPTPRRTRGPGEDRPWTPRCPPRRRPWCRVVARVVRTERVPSPPWPSASHLRRTWRAPWTREACSP
mmetsp:Transcript_3664/g.12355  ORF Transcript_3664/g.12355 Transcript_3664/m.12355 type:complete len:222 (-) Transcript_3664:114-779(-)